MTTIKSTREIYNKISKPIAEKPRIIDSNKELMDTTIDKLNKTPIFTPKVK